MSDFEKNGNGKGVSSDKKATDFKQMAYDFRNNKNKKDDMSHMHYGKVQPQAIPLEEAVLGALMLDKDAVTTVMDVLSPESFYLDGHKAIYKAILRLFEKSHPVDMLTVNEELKKNGELELAGGSYHLVELTNRVASTANIEYHARIISQKHIQRELIRVSNTIIKDAYEDTTDVFGLLDSAEQGLFEITQKNLSRNYESLNSLAPKMLKMLEDLKDKKDGLTGVPTGFTDIDRLTSGWQPSDMIILAARPGMGKTSMVLALAKNAAMDFQKPVAIFSLEMSSIQLVQRLVSMEAEISGQKMRNGKFEEYEIKQLQSAIHKISEVPIFIDDTPGINIFELRAKCRRMKKQNDIQMVIIDYLQLMTGGSDNQKGNREQEISAISRALKGMAKELGVPVIALSQLSRAVEMRGGTKRPQLSDLRECITGDTDIYLPETGEFKTVLELIKNKDNFKVLALDTETLKLKNAKCLDIWETGEKEVFEIQTQSGHTIKTSLNHPFFTPNGWQQLVDLKVGDYVATSRKLKGGVNTELKDEEIILLAHMLGDGCYVKRQPIHYTSKDPESRKVVIDCANKAIYKSNISRQRMTRIANVLEDEHLHSLADSDLKWEKIKSITHIGKEMTYDLHIEEHHNFMANNFIVHNSGAIEQDADMVTFIYRPEYYQIEEDEEGQSLKGIAEFIVAKNRHGATETIKLRFVGEFAKFQDLGDPNFDDLPTDTFSPSADASTNIITRPSKMNDEDIPF